MNAHPFSLDEVQDGSKRVDPIRLLARSEDQLDDATSLIYGAEMACADLDNETERVAIKSVLYAAKKRVADAIGTIEAARDALRQDKGK